MKAWRKLQQRCFLAEGFTHLTQCKVRFCLDILKLFLFTAIRDSKHKNYLLRGWNLDFPNWNTILQRFPDKRHNWLDQSIAGFWFGGSRNPSSALTTCLTKANFEKNKYAKTMKTYRILHLLSGSSTPSSLLKKKHIESFISFTNLLSPVIIFPGPRIDTIDTPPPRFAPLLRLPDPHCWSRAALCDETSQCQRKENQQEEKRPVFFEWDWSSKTCGLVTMASFSRDAGSIQDFVSSVYGLFIRLGTYINLQKAS